MNVSIEISTYNRKGILGEALKHLAVQTYPADLMEVILSDDGSDDGLIEMAQSMQRHLPYRLKILGHGHNGPAHAHNRGIEAARSEIVIMLAADVLAAPQLVEQHVKSHKQHPAENIMISGGLNQSPDIPDTLFQRSWNRMLNRMFEEEENYLRHGFFFVSNISFKKAYMMRHGMFLEWPPASMEDLELGYRLRNCGMSLIRNSAALGYHYHPVSIQSVANRAYTEGYRWHQFEARVPGTWIRARSGHLTPADGRFRYYWSSLKRRIRSFVVNDFTVRVFIVPLTAGAEQWRFLKPVIGVFTGLLAFHHFNKGIKDYEQGAVYNSVHSDI